MGIIVCQSCGRTIEHFEEEKVTILYAHSSSCPCAPNKEVNREMN